MATSFPSSLDSFTNPSASDALDSVSVPHADQHANLNDAMEAVQAKLGVGAGTIGEWTAYTPTFVNMTVGNGIVDYKYAVVNGIVFIAAKFELGSTSSIGTNPFVSQPIASVSGKVWMGIAQMNNTGVAAYVGWVGYRSTTSHYLGVIDTSSTYAGTPLINASVPFSWGTGDNFGYVAIYEAA